MDIMNYLGKQFFFFVKMHLVLLYVMSHFDVYPSVLYTCYRDARVMWDQKTGRSRGFGFVSFRNQQVRFTV